MQIGSKFIHAHTDRLAGELLLSYKLHNFQMLDAKNTSDMRYCLGFLWRIWVINFVTYTMCSNSYVYSINSHDTLS